MEQTILENEVQLFREVEAIFRNFSINDAESSKTAQDARKACRVQELLFILQSRHW